MSPSGIWETRRCAAFCPSPILDTTLTFLLFFFNVQRQWSLVYIAMNISIVILEYIASKSIAPTL